MITLYHTTHCPNCHMQEKILEQLQRSHPDLQYQKINLETETDIDVSPPIRSVPTLLIDDYRFEGLRRAPQLEPWLTDQATLQRDLAYLKYLLEDGNMDFATSWYQQHPHALAAVPALLSEAEVPLPLRIGLDALIETLAEQGLLADLVEPLGQLMTDAAEPLLIDLCHYLALSQSSDAVRYIESCLQHPHPEVQKAARETLAELQSSLGQ